MSWSEFNSQVRNRGLARTNRYKAIIPIGNEERLLSIFCESTTIPGINISTTPQRIFGETREMPYEKMYDPVQMIFYVDSQMAVKGIFDDWLASVISTDRRTVQYYDSYVRPIELYVLTVDGQEPYRITLFEAYPKSMGTITMSAESKDIMKLPITFQYKYWKSDTVSLKEYKQVTQSLPSVDSQGILTPPALPQLFGPLYT